MDKCDPEKCPFRLLQGLCKAGLKDFTIHQVTIQDKTAVKLVIVIEDKPTTLTL
jgi:hypothetical protein